MRVYKKCKKMSFYHVKQNLHYFVLLVTSTCHMEYKKLAIGIFFRNVI